MFAWRLRAKFDEQTRANTTASRWPSSSSSSVGRQQAEMLLSLLRCADCLLSFFRLCARATSSPKSTNCLSVCLFVELARSRPRWPREMQIRVGRLMIIVMWQTFSSPSPLSVQGLDFLLSFSRVVARAHGYSCCRLKLMMLPHLAIGVSRQ